MSREMLVEYVRDDKFRIVGAVVAIGKNAVGWSLCHPNQNKFDRKSKELAVTIASGRAEKGTKSIPHPKYELQIRNMLDRIDARSVLYFKDNLVCAGHCSCHEEIPFKDILQYREAQLATYTP